LLDDSATTHSDLDFSQWDAVQQTQLVEIPSIPKSDQDRAFLMGVLKDNFVFADLTETELSRMVDAFVQESVPADTLIIQQGDICDADYYFYILASGMVKFLVDGEEVFRNDEPGAAFGELELLYDNFPRAATCQAVQDSVLWKVDQATFRRIVSRYSIEQDRSATKLRQQSPLFRQAEYIDTETLTQLAECLTKVVFRKGESIVSKGDLGEAFYIIQKGTVTVSDIGTGRSPMVDQTLSAGDWFGELELQTGEPRVANVVATSDQVIALAMSKDDYLRLVCPILQPILDRESRKRFLKALPIFANSNSNFTDTELYLLTAKLQELAFETDHVVVDGSKDHADRKLWIIRHGNVSLFDGHSTHHLTRGDYFGDKVRDEGLMDDRCLVYSYRVHVSLTKFCMWNNHFVYVVDQRGVPSSGSYLHQRPDGKSNL